MTSHIATASIQHSYYDLLEAEQKQLTLYAAKANWLMLRQLFAQQLPKIEQAKHRRLHRNQRTLLNELLEEARQLNTRSLEEYLSQSGGDVNKMLRDQYQLVQKTAIILDISPRDSLGFEQLRNSYNEYEVLFRENSQIQAHRQRSLT